MPPRIDEIAADIYRINVELPARPVTYSFFLIRDEAPTLVETGFRAAFPETIEALATLVDVRELRYVVVPHLESDECGALNPLLASAPSAVPVCSPIGQATLSDLVDRPAQAVGEKDCLDLGHHSLRFLLTPYVHQWDSLLAFEEESGTLFSSDLFIERGRGPAITDQDLSESMVETYKAVGILPSRVHLDAALGKIEALTPATLACHHGTVKSGHLRSYLDALRSEEVTGIVRPNPFMSEPGR